MNPQDDSQNDREAVLGMFRYSVEWDRQFALLPMEEREMIIANPAGEGAVRLQERVEEAIRRA